MFCSKTFKLKIKLDIHQIYFMFMVPCIIIYSFKIK